MVAARPAPADTGRKAKKKKSLLDRIVSREIGDLNSRTRQRTAEKKAAAKAAKHDRDTRDMSADAAEARVNRKNKLRDAVYAVQGKPKHSDPLHGDRDGTSGARRKPPVKQADRLGNNQSGKKIAGDWHKAAAANQRKREAAKQAAAKNKPGGSGSGKGHGRTTGGGKNKPNKSQGTPGGSKTPAATKAPVTDYKSRADSAVDLMLNPKINALLRNSDQIASEYTSQKNELNRQTAAQLAGLDDVYKSLDNMLAGYGQQTDQAYQQGATKQTQAYDQFQQALQGVTADQQSSVGNELARLGLTGTADQSQLTGDAAFVQGLAQTNKSNAAATLANMQANAQQFNNAQRGSSQQQGAEAQSVARQSAVEMLNELLSNRNQGIQGIRSQIADVKGQRGSLMNQLMEQYEQQSYERMMEERQQGFMNQMNVNEFNLDQDQFNADQAYRQAQLALAGQTEARQQAEANSPAAVKNGGYAKGFTGAQGYLQKNMTDPKRLAALTSILQKIDTHRQRGKGIHDFSQGSPSDIGKALRYGYSFLDDPGFGQFNGPRSRSLLAQALNAYFGKL